MLKTRSASCRRRLQPAEPRCCHSHSPGFSTEARWLPALDVRTAAGRRQYHLDPLGGSVELNQVWWRGTRGQTLLQPPGLLGAVGVQASSLCSLSSTVRREKCLQRCWGTSLGPPPGGRRAAQRRQVVVARDVAVDGEVVVAQGVFVGVRGVAKGTLALCGVEEEENVMGVQNC